jgi:hypothetical protein
MRLVSIPFECRKKSKPHHDQLINIQALSYTWGSRHSAANIAVVDDVDVEITTNLFTILRRVRREKASRHLWVDGICINQSDNNEKAHQVAIMGNIYANTSDCIIWWGEEPDEPVKLMSDEQVKEIDQVLKSADELLLKLSEDFKFLADFAPPEDVDASLSKLEAIDDFQISKTKPFTWTLAKPEINMVEKSWEDIGADEDSIWHAFALFRMLSSKCHIDRIPYLSSSADSKFGLALKAARWLLLRPWWTRVWTVQECVLPKSATVYYGPVKAPFRMFELAVQQLNAHKTTCCTEIVGIQHSTGFINDALGNLLLLRQNILSAENKRQIGLEHVLRIFRNRVASNDKDKVYGLLGLVGDWRQVDSIVPDYSKTVSKYEVYTQTVLKIINFSANLDVLLQGGLCRYDPMKPLPSWVPDYSVPDISFGEGTLYVDQIRSYKAAQDLALEVEVIEKYVLFTKGYLVDEIDTTLKVLGLSVSRNSQMENITIWYDMLLQHFKNDFTSHQKDFWQTLCGGTVYEPATSKSDASPFRRLTAMDEQLFNQWCTSRGLLKLRTTSDEHVKKKKKFESVGPMDQAIRTSVIGRQMIVTKKGYIGMTSVGAEAAGYMHRASVFVIPGSRTPLLLEAVGTRLIPGRGMQQCYTLVGHCYLNGFMDGEGLSPEKGTELYLV